MPLQICAMVGKYILRRSIGDKNVLQPVTGIEFGCTDSGTHSTLQITSMLQNPAFNSKALELIWVVIDTPLYNL